MYYILFIIFILLLYTSFCYYIFLRVIVNLQFVNLLTNNYVLNEFVQFVSNELGSFEEANYDVYSFFLSFKLLSIVN